MIPNDIPTVTRRSVLKTTAAAGAAAATGAAFSGSALAQDADLQSWFEGVSNYDGVVDKTGQSEVTVEVGVEANNGPYGFGPAAIRVDPGTTVTWEWVEGSHNVAAEDGSFESELTNETGFTFTQTFQEEGVTRYACTPHKTMGMKGAVVVGDVDVGASSSSGSSEDSGSSSQQVDFEGWFEGVENFDGVVDKTGNSEVTVEVGTDANGGPYGFGPAAIRVDPGTTVTFEWVNGTHNVVAEDGSYESELTNESGFTFTQTYDSEGISKYYCNPHRTMGMKGAVVVGSGGSASNSGGGGGGGLTNSDIGVLAFAGALVGGLLSPFALRAKKSSSSPSNRR
ncbi:halocyanin domain-containing protein [Halobacterium sp. KA-4]|uniref:halocyanin domain-containing protein n=1 Tax=Halobacterium sp. KA-4 TaxID=2896367 RepID=UPI001E3BED1A|nr:halocyanin domain-containing protein [Halobacterium sp. KA-4]MCD2199726.1 halocyanin domain-containing protein [Halobacterium sp. KA-4]